MYSAPSRFRLFVGRISGTGLPKLYVGRDWCDGLPAAWHTVSPRILRGSTRDDLEIEAVIEARTRFRGRVDLDNTAAQCGTWTAYGGRRDERESPHVEFDFDPWR